MLAVLIAVGIGLHNFGEGLAIGAAFALGEAALGTLLDHRLHASQHHRGARDRRAAGARTRCASRDLVKLGLIGERRPSPGRGWADWSTRLCGPFCFWLSGPGAIAQVILQIGKQTARDLPMMRFLATGHVMAGLFAGFAVMYATGMLVG